jgi:RNA polymerase sporulation-specific sigma factor
MSDQESSLASSEVLNLIENNETQLDTETKWLVHSAQTALDSVRVGRDLAIEIGILAESYNVTGGGADRLISESSGIVALVSLHHVLRGRVAARTILEATPSLILDVAKSHSEDNEFSSTLADSVEAFCLSHEESEKTVNLDKHGYKKYSTVELTQLALRARDGDSFALNEVFTLMRHRSLKIVRESGYFLVGGGNYEDISQDALTTLSRSLKNFDPDKSNFSSYADMVMKKAMLTSIKTYTRDKHKVLTSAYSIDISYDAVPGDGGATQGSHVFNEDLSDNRNLEDVVMLRETLSELPQVLSHLSKFERQCLILLANGYTYKEVAKATSSQVKSIDNATQRAKKKLSDYFEYGITPSITSKPIKPIDIDKSRSIFTGNDGAENPYIGSEQVEVFSETINMIPGRLKKILGVVIDWCPEEFLVIDPKTRKVHGIKISYFPKVASAVRTAPPYKHISKRSATKGGPLVLSAEAKKLFTDFAESLS